MSWEEVRLGDICEFKYGKNLPEQSRINGKYPVYGSSSIIDTHEEFLVEGPGIIVGRKGTVGKVQYSKDDFFPIDTVFYIEHNPLKVNLKYLFYRLSYCGLENMNSDAAVPGLNRNLAMKQKVNLPSLKIQEKIVNLISNYDNLIENNNKRIKLLENMAEEIYKEWFVRLRFPNYQNTKIVDGIPAGWEKVTVDSLLQQLKGTVKIKTSEILKKGLFPVVDQSKDFIAGYTNEKDINYFKGIPFIVFGDHTRALKLINFSFAKGADGVQVLVSNNGKMPQTLFYHSLINIDLSNFHYSRHLKFLKKEKILLPTAEIANKFNSLTEKLYKEIDLLRDKNQNLIQTRDLLLPRLISGKLNIEDLDIK